MKRLALLLVVLFILVAPSFAQTESFIVANVPFAFHVGDTKLPAGDYRVGYLNSLDASLIFVNFAAQEIVRANAHPVQKDPAVTTKLVFRKYSDENYFLSAVGMPGHVLQQLPQSKKEREVVSHQLIVTKANPEEITVVARVLK